MGKSQTECTKRYQKKVGLIAKSYKLKKELTEEFAKACQLNGVSQAAQLSKMMLDFIESTQQPSKKSDA